MFEKMTFKKILADMLNRVDNMISKIEGSFIYTALAPVAFEIERAYVQMDYVNAQLDINTADYDSLVRMCEPFGIIPFGATYTQAKAQFNVPVPPGSRFSIGRFTYVVTSIIDASTNTYLVTCEQKGNDSADVLGDMMQISYIAGLTSAKLVEILVPGRDQETVESLRERYKEYFQSKYFAGNRADYIRFTKSIPGMGYVKVYPAWNGGGTVKLVITNQNGGVASSYLISTVQNTICPEPGQGVGIAPIGHNVTIESVVEHNVSVSCTLTFENGYTAEDVRADAETAIKEYFKSLIKEWEISDGIVIRIAQLESRILGIHGVRDIADTKMNGTAQNVVLLSNEVPAFRGLSI